MSYAKQFPIRITLAAEDYNLLIEGLKNNESDYACYIADDAKALREKIETHGRRETDADGDEVVRLGFFENEGNKFIRQFIAAVLTARNLHTEIASHEEIHEASENLIETQKRLIELLQSDNDDEETENEGSV